jgi:hypothetical protein
LISNSAPEILVLENIGRGDEIYGAVHVTDVIFPASGKKWATGTQKRKLKKAMLRLGCAVENLSPAGAPVPHVHGAL